MVGSTPAVPPVPPEVVASGTFTLAESAFVPLMVAVAAFVIMVGDLTVASTVAVIVMCAT